MQYLPGRDNVVADALSRYAYPAAKAFQDASFHGSLEAAQEMQQIIQEELEESKMIGQVTQGEPSSPTLIQNIEMEFEDLPDLEEILEENVVEGQTESESNFGQVEVVVCPVGAEAPRSSRANGKNQPRVDPSVPHRPVPQRSAAT